VALRELHRIRPLQARLWCARIKVLTDSRPCFLIVRKIARRRLMLRLRKAGLGHLGDIKPVALGLYEMRDLPGQAESSRMSATVAIKVMRSKGEESKPMRS